MSTQNNTKTNKKGHNFKGSKIAGSGMKLGQKTKKTILKEEARTDY